MMISSPGFVSHSWVLAVAVANSRTAWSMGKRHRVHSIPATVNGRQAWHACPVGECCFEIGPQR